MSGHDDLTARGFTWTGQGRCRECRRPILWYRTFNNKHAPFDQGTYAPHHSTCGKARTGNPKLSDKDREFLGSIGILDTPEKPKAKPRRTPGQLPIEFDDIDVFYLAGGFGRHVNVEASKRIGLVPSLASAKIVQAGNVAIEGATIALLSKSKRKELEDLVKKVEHCRLETHPNFFEFFVEGCQFMPVEPMPCAK